MFSKTTASLLKTIALAALLAPLMAPVSAVAQKPAAARGGDRAGLPAGYDGPASAVAAIVNDKVITTFDVQQRMRLMILSSGGQIAPQMLPQLQQQAVKDLVEDELKIQEAKKYDLVAEDAEINDQISQMAASSGSTPEHFAEVLKNDGVSVQALRSEIASSIVWPRLVQGRYGKRARVSDEEVDATLERLRADATQEQMLISEICIPIPSPDQAEAYYKGSLNLIEQMRKGVPFAVVAQQFSACTTAAAGGDMGWMRASELPPEIDDAIRALPPGSVTNPIPVDGALMIMAVRDRRAAVKQGEKSWTLAYAATPVETGRAAAHTLLDKLSTAEACAGGRTLRQDLGPDVGVSLIENVTLADVDPRFRQTVENIDRKELSDIIEADGAFHVLYGCEIDEGLGIPARSVITDRIYSRQLERIAQQYLRDVERKSTVDIRLGTQRRQQQPQEQSQEEAAGATG